MTDANHEAHEAADALARLAARALEIVVDATVIGLGTGRAASAFVRALGAEVRAGRRVRGVPTSEASAALARASGIPLTGLDEPSIEVTVDGADEVDPDLNLIKRSEEHTSELQSLRHLVCRLLLEKK